MRFKHYKGGEYEFVCLAFRDTGTPSDPLMAPVIEPMVVYRRIVDGTTWVRPAAEFFGPVGLKHEPYLKRFTPLVPPKDP
jgi:hypothetical protein